MILALIRIDIRNSRARTNITSRPIVTIISNANPNQPSTIAVTPTPVDTDPFSKFSAIVAAATLAVCCHNTDTRTKIAATKITARAI